MSKQPTTMSQKHPGESLVIIANHFPEELKEEEQEEANISEDPDNTAAPEQATIGLLCTTRTDVKPMNFQEKICAHMDLDNLLTQANIILDEEAATLNEVLRRMLTNLLDEGPEMFDIDEVMSSLFRAGGGQACDVNFLTHVIQEVKRNSVHSQKSWLCVLATVGSLQKRHVCITRLEQPQNWGVTCCEARYVILILAKSTKTATELGRTFVTMFLDNIFRQKLLEARTKDEFKQVLVFKRQQLSLVTEEQVNEEVGDCDPCSAKNLQKNNNPAMELGIVIATMFLDNDFRQKLSEARTKDEFKQVFEFKRQQLIKEQVNEVVGDCDPRSTK